MNTYFYISKIFTPIIIPSNFLIFILIILFYLGIYKNKFYFKKLFTIFFICFSLIAILPVGQTLIYHFLEKDFINLSVQKDIDYIFVPSGGRDRLIKAIIIKDKYDLDKVKIIYSTGRPYLNKAQSKDSELKFVKNLIPNSKVNKEDFIFLPEARNTLENFSRLNQYLLSNNEKDSKILLITHGYHLKRSIMLANKYKLQIYPLPSFMASYSDTKGFINSYQKISVISNLRKFDLFVKELISTFFSYFL